MSTWNETWKEINTDLPSLLPLGPVPQEPDPGKMLQYLQGLHNYLAGDRLSVIRAINILARYRNVQTDGSTDPTLLASGSGTLKVNVDTSAAYFDSIKQDSGSGAKWKPLVPAYAADTSEPTGFVNTNADTSISISGGNFTITPSGTSFSFYVKGEKFTKTAADSISLAAATTEGNYWIYYDNTGTLILDDSATFEDIIRDNCFVAELYHNGTSVSFLMDERHGLMPWQTHLWLHLQEGTVRRAGLGLSSLTVDQAGNNDVDAELDWDSGTFVDEDLQHSASAKGFTTWRNLYLINGAWQYVDNTTDSPVVLDAGVPSYNDVSTPGSEALAPVTVNRFFLMHVFATNIMWATSSEPKYVAICGQNQYLTKTAARDAANTEISDLITGVLPMPEFVPVGTVIFQRKGTNSYNSAVVSTDAGEDYVSWLGAEIQPGSPPSAHPNLTLRDDPNQHPLSALEGGSSYPFPDDMYLSGNLYIDTSSNASLYVRESGNPARYVLVKDNGRIGSIRKLADAGDCTLEFDALVGDGTSAALIDFFYNLSTTSTTSRISIYNNTPAVQHRIYAEGDVEFCKISGTVTSYGNLFCDKTADPSLYLREGGSTTSYLRLTDNGAVATIYKYEPTACTLRLDSLPGDGTSTATAEFFRTTNTSGTVQLLMRKGNNSTTIAHALYGGSAGSAELCREGIGNLTIGASGGGARLTVAGGDVRIDNTYSYQCENSSNSPIDVLGMDASNIIGVGNASYRPVIKSTDVVRIAAGNSVPADAVLSNSEITFSTDESGDNLLVKVKYSTGTVKTGTVCALT